ncbi:MAG TPA: BrnT family toxin [Nitrospiraceae bacterium]|nr:BrnT family toxin [Nitrospiraceae bacterium]
MFEWDSKKAALNEAKHGISFMEASTAFFDPAGIDGEDVEHSTTEARRFRLARSAGGNTLVIAYTVRSHSHEKNIRIISARLANRKEKRRYQAEKD